MHKFQFSVELGIMDNLIEEKFVKNFIIKDKRERILHELSSTKKRKLAVQRLYSLLDNKFAVMESSKIGEEEIISAIKKYFNVNKDCYVIADGNDDRETMPFKVALKNMLEYEMNYVIICDENTIIAGEEYNTYCSPSKMILHKN